MLVFALRRLVYALTTVFGVLVFLFVLFFASTKPEDIARKALGERVTDDVIQTWIHNHGYDRPMWPSAEEPLDNLFVEHFRSMLTFDFGVSDMDEVPITERLAHGAPASLRLTVPMFVIGVFLGIAAALTVAFFRETLIDRVGLLLSVIGMSVSLLIYIIVGQFIFAKTLRWFPLSGYDSTSIVMLTRFMALPVLIGVLKGLGGDVRFYRTVFIEEIHRDYVRTAKAKGASDARVMGRHVLPNAMVPIITSVVMAIPFLFTGSLLLEAAFGIPGLGSLTVDAINNNDFSTLRAMVYLGALLFIGGQVVTDICYALFDPRIRIGDGQ